MKKTITLTKDELIKACAEASADLMKDDKKNDENALNKALLYVLVGARMADKLVTNLFGEDKEKSAAKDTPDAEPVNHTHD